jgi:hypothetical protein
MYKKRNKKGRRKIPLINPAQTSRLPSCTTRGPARALSLRKFLPSGPTCQPDSFHVTISLPALRVARSKFGTVCTPTPPYLCCLVLPSVCPSPKLQSSSALAALAQPPPQPSTCAVVESPARRVPCARRAACSVPSPSSTQQQQASRSRRCDVCLPELHRATLRDHLRRVSFQGEVCAYPPVSRVVLGELHPMRRAVPTPAAGHGSHGVVPNPACVSSEPNPQAPRQQRCPSP